MIEAWAEKIALSIKEANKEETTSVAVMKYALIIVINFLIPYTTALLVGLLTHRFAETLLAVVVFIFIRAFSGGYHFKSAIACVVVSACVTTIPPHLHLSDKWIVVFTAISFIAAAILAPAHIKGYARMPEKYFPLMKVISLFVIGSNFIIHSSTMAIIFLLQAISLFDVKEVK